MSDEYTTVDDQQVWVPPAARGTPHALSDYTTLEAWFKDWVMQKATLFASDLPYEFGTGTVLQMTPNHVLQAANLPATEDNPSETGEVTIPYLQWMGQLYFDVYTSVDKHPELNRLVEGDAS